MQAALRLRDIPVPGSHLPWLPLPLEIKVLHFAAHCGVLPPSGRMDLPQFSSSCLHQGNLRDCPLLGLVRTPRRMASPSFACSFNIPYLSKRVKPPQYRSPDNSHPTEACSTAVHSAAQKEVAMSRAGVTQGDAEPLVLLARGPRAGRQPQGQGMGRGRRLSPCGRLRAAPTGVCGRSGAGALPGCSAQGAGARSRSKFPWFHKTGR